MKRLILLTLIASMAFAGQVLLEDIQAGENPVSEESIDCTIAGVSFTTEDEAVVMITTKCQFIDIYPPGSWLEIDGDSIAVTTSSDGVYVFSDTYMTALPAGNHTIEFHGKTIRNGTIPDPEPRLRNVYLQVLIMTPDDSQVMEKPDNPHGDNPRSVISYGSPLSISGVEAIYDIIGREVTEAMITADRVNVSSLPQGQYFAHREDGGTTKITVVK